MAYADRYIAEFENHAGETVGLQIQEDGYVGTAEEIMLAADPVAITVSDRLLYDSHIMGLGCEIRVINTDYDTDVPGNLTRFDNLFSSYERKHKVIIKIGSYILFEGFIMPGLYTQTIKHKSVITIPATNQIASLKSYYSEIFEFDYQFSTVTLISIIQDILNSTGLECDLYIKNTLWSELYDSAFSLATTCYDKLKVNRQIFIDRDDIMSGYDVLEEILKVTGSRLYYSNGKWIIDRIRDAGETTSYKIYPFTGVNSTGTLAHTGFELADYPTGAGSGHLTFSIGKKEYNVIIDFDKYDNLIDPGFAYIMLPFFGIDPSIGTWWIIADVDIINRSYNSVNCLSGLHYERGTVDVGTWTLIPIRTSFIVDIKDDVTSFAISYIYDDLKNVLGADWTGSYALKYKVGGDWRMLIRDGNEIVPDTTKLYASIELQPRIETTTTIIDEAVKNRKLEMNDVVNISEIITTVNSDLSSPDHVIFNLEIFPVRRDTTAQAIQKVGDLVVSQNNEISKNVITGELNSDFVEEMNVKLRLYDGEYYNYKNSLLVVDSPISEVLSNDWNDNNGDFVSAQKLHYVLIHNLSQQFNKCRHSISIDMMVQDAATRVTPGSIFTYASQLPDKDFYVTGMAHNVKKNAYRLQLAEYKGYDNFDIV